MLTIQEVNEILNELVDELPTEVFTDLSGGISLVPERKVNPQGRSEDLLIMGEYRCDQMGKRIVIYYGSFVSVLGECPFEMWKDRLRQVLRHEFVHHLEIMAGEHGLEAWDRKQIERYKRGLPLEREEWQ